MGMFDYVAYECDCEKCGEPLSNFQSKDAACNMDTIGPSQVDYFYTTCDKCGSWHDFEVNRVCTVSSIDVSSLPPKR